MALSGLWSRLTGGIFGVGVGVAAADAMTPVIEPARQTAWENNPFKVLDVGTLAELVAQGLIDQPTAEGEALRDGYAAFRTDGVVQSKLTVPGVGDLLRMLNRGTVNTGNLSHAFRKQKLEPMWDTALTDLQNVYLSPDILAVMLQRSVIPNQGQLPGVSPAGPGNVPRFPQVSIDAYAMAKTFGWDQQQLDAQSRIQGLPPGMDLVARGVFRNIFTQGDFELAAEQSNRRVEWAPLEFDVYRQIPTAHDFIEGYLRGWITKQQMYAGTALHGMSQADSDLIYDISGRPLDIHQVTTGLARGGKYGGYYQGVPSPYLEAMQQSNVRPEWGNIAYANRYSYPSAFVLRSLAQAGDIGNTAAVQQVLEEIGWNPTFAQTVAASWTGGATGADPHVAKAATQLWSTVHASYKAEESIASDVTPALNLLGIPAAAQQQIFAYWDAERALIRKQLSPSQIAKAVKEGVVNPATGAAWTTQEGMQALAARGFSPQEAQTLLEL